MNAYIPIDLIKKIDEQRGVKGFLGLEKILLLSMNGNLILDPFSTLISESAIVGSNNVFYPGVIIEISNGGSVHIGDNNVFYSNSFLLADMGSIIINNDNQFGDGGLSIKANSSNSEIIIGNNGRYLNGAQIIGRTNLGSGSQIIGNITVQNCELVSGGTYQDTDPDMRAGVLKGFGLARNIIVDRGKVLHGSGTFNQQDIQDQSFYHPKKG